MRRMLLLTHIISIAFQRIINHKLFLRSGGLSLLWGFLFFLGFSVNGLFAQTVGLGTGCFYGRWGIDAGLYSGVIEFGAGVEPVTPPYSRDWFQGTQGDGLINQSNTTAIQSLLQAPGNPTYEARMKYGLVSIQNGQVLVDGLYARDQFGGTGFMDPTSFNTASKNGEDPAIWDPGEQNVLGKNDILDVGGHMYRDGTGFGSNLWFMGLFNMAEPGGTSYMDFEFFVDDVEYNSASGFTSGGPQLGHTAYNFDTPGNITKIGDFIFSVSISGSEGPIVETRLWVSRADWMRLGGSTMGSIPTFKWAGTFDGAFNGSPFGYAGILPLGNGQVCGYLNMPGQLPLAPPWGTKGTKTNTWGTNYIEYSVAEVGINLTAFGMDHSSLSGADPCFFPLNTFIVKTRASASFTAQLKDFAGPYSWGQPRFDIDFDNTLISCDNETASISVATQRNDVNYLWSSLDGNILNVQPYSGTLPSPFGNALLVDPNNSSTILGIITGTNPWEITIDKVGTYKLDVTLPNGCPVPSGSVYVGLDPTKPYFNGPPTFSTSVPCNDNDGTITVSASGATKPYTFFLYKDGNLQTTVPNINTDSYTFTGLVAGNYRVDVKGVYACIETTGPITLPARIPVVIAPTLTQVNCFGYKTGAINLDVTGGNPALSYLWSTGNTSQDLLNIGAGDYTVTITDASGCVTTATYSITQPTVLAATITKVDDPGNAGGGSATVNASGGTGPYSYQWRKTPVNTIIGTAATLSNIGYGEYSVTVTDALGCAMTLSVFIYEKERCDPANSLIDNDGDGLVGCDDPDCVPPTPTSIMPGDLFPCKGEAVAYMADPATGYDSYVWTVPANATIVDNLDGPTTNPVYTTGATIRVIWNTIAGGQICVQGKVYNCLSAPKCIQVNVNDVPIMAGGIIINGGN